VIVISDFSDTNFGEFVAQEMRLKFGNENLELDGFGYSSGHWFGHARL
jgi:hypothetical protein